MEAVDSQQTKFSSSVLVVSGVSVYCIAGTLLTLVNKVAIKLFPFTCLLLILQNYITIVLLQIGACSVPKLGPLPDITWPCLKQWGPLTFLFTVMLFSSLEALKHVTAVSLVVLRNLTTVVVAVGEGIALKTPLTLHATLSIIGMLLSAIIYGASDLSFSALGYVWLTVNVVASSIYQVYVKYLAKQDGMTPMGMSFLNNSISLPMLGLCSIILAENPLNWYAKHGSDTLTWIVLVISGILGYMLSTSAFFLNQIISATSIMVANNSNKFLVILFSELFLQRSLGPASTAGAVLVLWFAYLYTKSGRSQSEGRNEPVLFRHAWHVASLVVTVSILLLTLFEEHISDWLP